MKTKSIFYLCIVSLLIVILGIFIISDVIYAQSWVAMPPYNVLWPLWSPVLSPPDPVTGVPTPLISTLEQNTFLPVEPALVWDPSLPYFTLLYNYIPAYGNPVIKYFDPLEGLISPYSSFKSWPPSYMQTAVTDPATGAITVIPSPITLPAGYDTLFTFDPASWLNFWVPLVNPFWQEYYGVNPYLLTAPQLLDPALTFLGTFI